jgi:hypothetical protein
MSGHLLSIGSDRLAWSHTAGLLLAIGWASSVATLLGRRLATTTETGRRLLIPVLLPGIVYIGLSVGVFGYGLEHGYPSNDQPGVALWFGQAIALTDQMVEVLSGHLGPAQRARETDSP